MSYYFPPDRGELIFPYRFDVARTLAPTYAKAATCTTCKFKEDASNYWTAVLYFKNPNGSYIRVSIAFR